MIRSFPSLLLPRRHLLQLGLGATVVAAAIHPHASRADEPADISDEDIFQFALNLEYMEAEYYLRGTTGKGIDDGDAGSDAGDVVGGKQVSFKTPAIGEFMREVAENELAHVRFYRKTLGQPPSRVPQLISTPGLPRSPRRRDWERISIRSATRCISFSAACCLKMLA